MASDAELQQRVADLRARLQEAGEFVTLDNRVRHDVAAQILTISPGTLRNWRTAGKGPRHYLMKQPWYRLDDLVAWLEAQAVE